MDHILRKAGPEDIRLLFDWANDAEVRKSSINTHTITFEEHEKWYNRMLNSPDCLMLIMEVSQEPVGQLRFTYDASDGGWKIGYSIAEKFRGKGFSKLLICEGVKLLNRFPVIAYVRPENERSKRVFISLHFSEAGMHQAGNVELVKFIKNQHGHG